MSKQGRARLFLAKLKEFGGSIVREEDADNTEVTKAIDKGLYYVNWETMDSFVLIPAAKEPELSARDRIAMQSLRCSAAKPPEDVR
jgi:hypothetical protein